MEPNRRGTWSTAALAIVGVGAVALAVCSKLGWPWVYAWRDVRDDSPMAFVRDRQAPWWPSVLFLGIGLRAMWWARDGLRTTGSISLGRLGTVLGALFVAVGASTWACIMAWNF